MGLFDVFKKKPEPTKVETPKAEEKSKKTKSAKDIATENGEPYVGIISVELDPENIGNGAFELDWNEKFITNLVRAGFQMKPNEDESVIVDRWFQEVCRNVIQENYEQWEANYATMRRVDKEDLGGGKTSVS
jgi:hypothetical protein